MLSPAALTQRREESCSKFKKHYYKKKKMLENDQNKDPLPSTSTAPLIFQLPSIKKHNFRKTYRRSLMKAYRSNKELLHKMSTLEKKNKTLQKRIERLKKTTNCQFEQNIRGR
jgi:hypothetical protein